jgi:hypothetical protein
MSREVSSAAREPVLVSLKRLAEGRNRIMLEALSPSPLECELLGFCGVVHWEVPLHFRPLPSSWRISYTTNSQTIVVLNIL